MGRHYFGGIGGDDPQVGFRQLRLSGDEGMGVGVFLQGGVGADGVIHPQVGLTFIGIGTVAGEAFIGEDGPDIEVIADGVGEIVRGQVA